MRHSRNIDVETLIMMVAFAGTILILIGLGVLR